MIIDIVLHLQSNILWNIDEVEIYDDDYIQSQNREFGNSSKPLIWNECSIFKSVIASCIYYDI